MPEDRCGCEHVTKWLNTWVLILALQLVQKLLNVGELIHLSGSLSPLLYSGGGRVPEAMCVHRHICICVHRHAICVKQGLAQCVVHLSTFPGAYLLER